MNWLENKLNGLANWYLDLRFGNQPCEFTQSEVRIVAHRGAWARPFENAITVENTIPAFRLAQQSGVWGIEFDVRWTKDFVPVVYHDPQLGRVFGPKGAILRSLTAKELRDLAPEIPFLEEVVQEFGGKTHLMIELKESIQENPRQIEILKKTLAGIVPKKDYHLMSLSPERLTELSFIDPKSVLSIAWLNTDQVVRKSIELGIGGATGHFVLFNPRLREELRTHGLGIGTGFVQSRGCLVTEWHLKTDWVFSNFPLELQAFLSKRTP